MWLEDPVPPENVAALARVTKSTSTPICTGENGYMRHGFREAFEAGAIDIAAPDPQKTGGLLETRRIADYADTHYISMAPHCIASPIGTVANVHVAAAIPNFLALEWHGMSVPFWKDLAAGFDGDRRWADRRTGQAWAGSDVESGSGARVRAARRALLRRMIAAVYRRHGRVRRAVRRGGPDAGARAGRGARAGGRRGREPDRLEVARGGDGRPRVRVPGAGAGRRGRDRGRGCGGRCGARGRARVGVLRGVAAPVGDGRAVLRRPGGAGGARCPRARRSSSARRWGFPP